MNSPKTILITGASRGIGRGIAIELARAGCRVALNYAGNVEAAAEALALVKAAGGDGFTVQGDVAVAADRQRLVSETIAKFGRIDVLVPSNEAALLFPVSQIQLPGPKDKLTDEQKTSLSQNVRVMSSYIQGERERSLGLKAPAAAKSSSKATAQ